MFLFRHFGQKHAKFHANIPCTNLRGCEKGKFSEIGRWRILLCVPESLFRVSEFLLCAQESLFCAPELLFSLPESLFPVPELLIGVPIDTKIFFDAFRLFVVSYFRCFVFIVLQNRRHKRRRNCCFAHQNCCFAPPVLLFA